MNVLEWWGLCEYANLRYSGEFFDLRLRNFFGGVCQLTSGKELKLWVFKCGPNSFTNLLWQCQINLCLSGGGCVIVPIRGAVKNFSI